MTAYLYFAIGVSMAVIALVLYIISLRRPDGKIAKWLNERDFDDVGIGLTMFVCSLAGPVLIVIAVLVGIIIGLFGLFFWFDEWLTDKFSKK